MNDAAPRKITLTDGRTLSWGEYGDASGRALFFFHGTPGSRLGAGLLDDAARARGVRVIAPERPGFGWSDPKRGRTLIDWSDDVRALADALRVQRFAVAGISGGGPYVAACAYALPDRVASAGILSGIGPTDHVGATHGMLLPNRVLLWTSRRVPPLARALAALLSRQLRNPERALARMARSLPEPDRRIVLEPRLRVLFVADFREALARGVDGAAGDFALFARPWGFRLDEIRVPVHLWHGELDRNCPVAMGRYVAAAIPGCRATIVPGEGHMFTMLRGEEVLKALGL
jgi:pimeloyl-ACP methyl ester carboxylesterase